MSSSSGTSRSKKSSSNSKSSKKNSKSIIDDFFSDPEDSPSSFRLGYPDPFESFTKDFSELLERPKKSSNTRRSATNSKSSKKNSKLILDDLSPGFHDLDENLNSFGLVHPELFESFTKDFSDLLERPKKSNNTRVSKAKEQKSNTREYHESAGTSRSNKKLDLDLIDEIPIVIKKTQSGATRKNQDTQRTLRSSRKYQDFLTDNDQIKDFSIYFIDWYYLKPEYYKDKLDTVLSDFSIYKSGRREGNDKLSYTYLLLDSRICKNTKRINWDSFIDAIFYVGKGKNNRAYDHMKEAENYLQSGRSTSKKINKIIDIWNDNGPVMILKTAENIMAEEALTREALIIDAIGKRQLCNIQDGTYYGVASTLRVWEKRQLGAVLLIEAKDQLIINGVDSVYPRNSKNKTYQKKSNPKKDDGSLDNIDDFITSIFMPFHS